MNRHTTIMQTRHGRPPASLPDRFARTFDVRAECRVTLYFLKKTPRLLKPAVSARKTKRPPTEAGGRCEKRKDKLGAATSDSANGKSTRGSAAFVWRPGR